MGRFTSVARINRLVGSVDIDRSTSVVDIGMSHRFIGRFDRSSRSSHRSSRSVDHIDWVNRSLGPFVRSTDHNPGYSPAGVRQCHW